MNAQMARRSKATFPTIDTPDAPSTPKEMAPWRSIPSRGFTLIELLVVISIIAVLIGILLPALAHAKETAQRVVCASNERDFLQGLHMYAVDSRGILPPHDADLYSPTTNLLAGSAYYMSYIHRGYITSAPNGRPTNLGWLFPNYLPVGSLFIRCPIQRFPGLDSNASVALAWKNNWNNTSGGADSFMPVCYEYRNLAYSLSNPRPAPYTPPLNKPVKADDASKNAIISDWITNQGASWAPTATVQHHVEGYNVGYVDGHARFVDDRDRVISGFNIPWGNNSVEAEQAWAIFDTRR